MVGVRFTYYASRLPDGRHKINLYIKDMEPTTEESPFCERKSMRDAAQLIREIVDENCNPEKCQQGDRMLLPGDPPDDSLPIFMFVIGITWNRALKCPHYTRVCYERLEMDGKWNPIAALGMEQYDYTMGVLRKLEKKIIAKNTAAKDK